MRHAVLFGIDRNLLLVMLLLLLMLMGSEMLLV